MLVDMLTNSLLGRLVDTDHKVRMLCIRGLGNVAASGPEQVSFHAIMVDILKVNFEMCYTF